MLVTKFADVRAPARLELFGAKATYYVRTTFASSPVEEISNSGIFAQDRGTRSVRQGSPAAGSALPRRVAPPARTKLEWASTRGLAIVALARNVAWLRRGLAARRGSGVVWRPAAAYLAAYRINAACSACSHAVPASATDAPASATDAHRTPRPCYCRRGP